ncbi:MAG: hypothetical protein VX473_06905 [Candidatus Thermoplasmatota archaeon]|nr:hypothetical protein [Candidatus Thermoplasmatota archaeon]
MSKMWAAFFLSVLLVSTLNFYAVVREPDKVEIHEIHEHLSETVKIEGTLISWVRDPYSDGSDRVDLQVEDAPHVVKVRWYDTSEVPTIGSTIVVEGEVVQYNGKIWINSKGMGAITQTSGWFQQFINETTLNDISADAESYRSKIVNISGYLSDAIEPDVTWQSFTLIDNPSYMDSDHRLYVSLQGRVTEWIEAGSKVKLTGWVQWDERNYRWSIVVQSSTIEVLHAAEAKRLSWAVSAETWSYDIGKLVYVEGTYKWDDGKHWIVAPGGENVGIICLIPNLNLTVNGTLPSNGFSGRLFWSEDRAQICLQMSDEDHTVNPVGLLLGDGDFTSLATIAANPSDWIGEEVSVAGWTTGAVSPDYDKGYIGDGKDYFERSTTLRFQIAGVHMEWIEKGTYIEFYNVTVVWNEAEGRIILDVPLYAVGTVDIPPDTFSWSAGWDAWTWQINTLVNVNGELNQTSNGDLWLVASGTDQRICLYDNAEGIGLATGFDEDGNSTGPRVWTGRLVAIDNSGNPGTQLCLTLP